MEGRQLIQLICAVTTLSVFVVLYARGGTDHKVLFRRILASFSYCLGCSILAIWAHHWNWVMLAGWPATYAWLTMGYGADNLPSKLRARALYGLIGGIVSGVWLLPNGFGKLWLFQIGIAIAASVFYGVTNPHSRVGEEGAIAYFMAGCAPFALIK